MTKFLFRKEVLVKRKKFHITNPFRIFFDIEAGSERKCYKKDLETIKFINFGRDRS